MMPKKIHSEGDYRKYVKKHLTEYKNRVNRLDPYGYKLEEWLQEKKEELDELIRLELNRLAESRTDEEAILDAASQAAHPFVIALWNIYDILEHTEYKDATMKRIMDIAKEPFE